MILASKPTQGGGTFTARREGPGPSASGSNALGLRRYRISLKRLATGFACLHTAQSSPTVEAGGSSPPRPTIRLRYFYAPGNGIRALHHRIAAASHGCT